MRMRIRFTLALILISGISILSANVHAAMTAEEWQAQLQTEMRKMSADAPSIKVNGDVTVKQENNYWVASLPLMTIHSEAGARFQLSSVRLVTNDLSSDRIKVDIRLPNKMPYHDQQGRELGYVTIATQNISGLWDLNGHDFDDLSGTLENVIYYDSVGRSQASIGHIALDATDARRPQLTASKIQSVVQQKDAVIRSSVQNAVLRYQFAAESKMTLPRVLGLLNPAWLLAEREDFTIDLTAKNLVHIDNMAQTTTIQDIVTRLQVLPNDKDSVLGGRINLVMQNVTQKPETAYSFILPSKLTLLGTLSNMPVQVLTRPMDLVHELMVEAGTRTDISEIVWDTASQTQLKGTGWLRAADNVPLGMVGRFVLTVDDLRALSANLQKQLSTPGANLKIKAQGYMFLMLLQSFIKSDGTVSEIILDFTPDGQVLVNNQDISSLVTQIAQKSAKP